MITAEYVALVRPAIPAIRWARQQGWEWATIPTDAREREHRWYGDLVQVSYWASGHVHVETITAEIDADECDPVQVVDYLVTTGELPVELHSLHQGGEPR